jgi:hypothetical protein
LSGDGLGGLWEARSRRFREVHEADGSFAARRAEQRVRWLKAAIDDGIRRRILADEGVRAALEAGEAAVRAGERAPSAVADAILDKLGFGTDPAAGTLSPPIRRRKRDRAQSLVVARLPGSVLRERMRPYDASRLDSARK